MKKEGDFYCTWWRIGSHSKVHVRIGVIGVYRGRGKGAISWKCDPRECEKKVWMSPFGENLFTRDFGELN